MTADALKAAPAAVGKALGLKGGAAALLGAGVLLGLAWWVWREGWLESAAPDAGGGEVPVAGDDSWWDKVQTGPGVIHRERADGTDERLQAFLDAWEDRGPFVIAVVPKGGLRTDAAEQAELHAQGVSGAATLADTPHGRGGAVDVAPYYRFAPHFEDWGPFEEIGAFAKEMGLNWGGDFSGLRDGPHLEVPGWRSLPYPPRGVA